MSSSPRRRAARLLLAAAACAGAVLPGASAAADEPAATTVVGQLVQAWPEQADPAAEHGHDAPLSWVRTAAGEAVRIPTAAVADVPAGSTVSVDVGGQVRDAASADGYEPAHDVLAADVLDTPDTSGTAGAGALTNQVTVAMVVPAGGVRDGATLASVVAAVNGPVARFWAEETGGAVRLGVTARHDWITTRAGCQDPNALWDEVAADVGFVPGPGRHLAVYLSSRPTDLPGCSYALGQVGTDIASGGRLYVRDVLPSVIAHELGHNFGLGHSSGLQCDGTVDTGTCRTAGYRDYYDVMGASWSSVGALTAAQADRLHVLPAAARIDVAPGAPDASYTLQPLAGTAGTRALRLAAADGSVYWLEYRAATGQDAWLGTPDNGFRLDAGVLLHRAGGLPDSSLLLDGTPSPAARWDGDLQAALPVGRPVTVDGGAFTVTVQAVAATEASVHVVAAPGVPAAADSTPAAPAAGPDVLPARGSAGRSAAGGAPAPATTPAGATTAEPGAGGAGQAPAAAGAAPDGPSPAAAPPLAEAAATGAAGPPPLALCAVAATAVLLGAAGLLRLRARSAARRR